MHPFDDFRVLLDAMPGRDEFAISLVKKRLHECSQPRGPIPGPDSMGKLAELATWYKGWRGEAGSSVQNAVLACFAGNNGILDNAPLLKNLVLSVQAGGAFVSNICRLNNVGLRVYDLALDLPTMDISQDAAMDERGCAATMAFGMEVIAGKVDLLCLTALGSQLAPIEAAVSCALYGGSLSDWGFSPGAGQLYEKLSAVLALHADFGDDSFEVLRRLGSREMAAMTGAILAARMEKIPVLLEGPSAMLSAAILHKLNPRAIDHCIIGQMAATPSNLRLNQQLELMVLLDLGLQEGSFGAGAALAASMLRGAVASLEQLQTFSQSQEKLAGLAK